MQVWEDQAIWNVDFCTLFPQMRVSELYVPGQSCSAHTCNRADHRILSTSRTHSNELERMYLTAMQFQVNVKASLYARACLCAPHVWRRRYLHTDLAYALCAPSLPPSPLSFPSLSPTLPASLASLDPRSDTQSATFCCGTSPTS